MRVPILLLILLAAFACKEISYREPQPKGKKSLSKVPASLHGRYLLPAENDSTTPDTIIIHETGYVVSGEPRDKAVLSDSLVLKYYKGYYFMNMHEKPEWLLRVLRSEKNGDLVCLSMEADDKNFKALITSLSKVIAIDSSEVNGKKLYQIDPTPKQLVRLLKHGHFKNKVVLKRIR